ncbi:hypothetical protein [Eubacterium barkeri]|uniref:hypothetical protein n=1 Tax=Eubacterium barkeri TaxID=1528 RepID=UPI000B801FB3|nr:hypothetical protein [Eubacterium barkeri]
MGLIYFIQISGVAAWAVVICFFLYFLVYIIKEKISEAIGEYKIKHRFDKPPTAKCYCRDCKMWDPETRKCSDHCNSRIMNDACFCCFAEPLSAYRLKTRQIIIDEEK